MDNYDVRILLQMAQGSLEADDKYQRYILTFKSGWVPSMDPGRYGDYRQRETSKYARYDALLNACLMVGADVNTVIATAKAMNRYEKKNRWQICANVGWRDGEKRLRRFFSEPELCGAVCYVSTGRRVKF